MALSPTGDGGLFLGAPRRPLQCPPASAALQGASDAGAGAERVDLELGHHGGCDL